MSDFQPMTTSFNKRGLIVLGLLEPGDSIMTDKGFNIRDLATKKRVYLMYHLFAKVCGAMLLKSVDCFL